MSARVGFSDSETCQGAREKSFCYRNEWHDCGLDRLLSVVVAMLRSVIGIVFLQMQPDGIMRLLDKVADDAVVAGGIGILNT